MQVEQVDFVSCRRGTARAIAFYRDVFGLPRASQRGELEPERDARVLEPGEHGRVRRERRGIALRVPTSRPPSRSSAAGGEFIGIADSGVCHMGFVKDLDGNLLILHRRYAPKEKRGQG